MINRTLEYVGYLPYLKNDLKVSSHPQFKHLAHPPENYAIRSETPWSELPNPLTKHLKQGTRIVKLEKLLRRGGLGSSGLKLISSASSLLRESRREGASFKEIGRFMAARLPHLAEQVLIPTDTKMAFVPSFPVLFGQVPWIIEIEDTTTLFYPFVHNGWSNAVSPKDIPCYHVIKAMLLSEQCRGIITHVRSTAESLPVIFESPELANKVFYVPLGVPAPPTQSVNRKADGALNLLFTNSWHQNAYSFYYRGGLDLIQAFPLLKERFPNLTLTLRSKIPVDLPERYKWLIESNKIRVLDKFLPQSEHDKLMTDTDIFVLPAARLHVVSILEMMGRGIPVLVSDGWGIEEYVEDGVNGIVARGRYGKTTWIDEQNGLLREDYSSLLESDPEYVRSLTTKLAMMIESPELRQKLSENGIRDVLEKHSLEKMNIALKTALDHTFEKN